MKTLNMVDGIALKQRAVAGRDEPKNSCLGAVVRRGVKGNRKWCRSLGVVVGFLLGGGCALLGDDAPVASTPTDGGSANASIPITFHLDQPGYVTVVVEDPKTGRHIANLLSDQLLAAGDQKIVWDGYDSGQEKRGTGWVRHRVAPGSYRLAGLVHDAIHLRYEFPFYSPGTPPWKTADGGGAWLADHSPPSSVLYLPPNWGSPFGAADQGQMLFSANVGEAGYALLWTDMNGKSVHGAKINGWMGGKAMARDLGPNRDTSVCAYTLYSGNPSVKNKQPNGSIELDAITTNPQDPFHQIWRHVPAQPTPYDGFQMPLSVSVFNGIAAVSSNLDGKVFFVDVKSKQELGSAALPVPRGVAWDSQGGLYAITNGAVKHYSGVQPDQGSLGTEVTVVPASQLDDPRQVLLDEANHRLYVSQWGKSHQVEVFDLSSGKLLLTIGHPGGPQLGPYDDHRMHHPNGMVLAPSPTGGNLLWVMEDDFIPKRISVWQPTDGSFVKAYYGPPQYGGGGTLDPADPTRLFYGSTFNFGSLGGMIFKLNWDTGEAKLTDIYALGPEPYGDSANLKTGPFGPGSYDILPEDNIPERPVYLNGQTYLIGSFNGRERGTSSGTVWKFDEKTGVAWPVAFVGGGSLWLERTFQGSTGFPNKAAEDAIETQLKALNGNWPDAFLTWSDLHGNHHADPDEWTVRTFPPDQTAYTAPNGTQAHATFFGGASLSATDLSYTGGWAVTVPAPTFNADGIPIYDISKARINLPPQAEFRSSVDGDSVARFDSGPDGWLLQWPKYGWKNGELQWTYPESDRRHPPSGPGDMLAVNHLMGPLITPKAGDAGPVAFMENDYGALYLMTVDGFFVHTLGGDERTTPLLDVAEAKRGMFMDNYSFNNEHWHTTVTQFKDGRICVVAGKEFCGIFTVLGLDSVRRVDLGTVAVTPNQIAGLPEEKTITVADSHSSHDPNAVYKTMSVPLLDTPPTVDGNLSDWPSDTQWVDIGNRGQGAICIANDRLYAAWKTNQPDLLKNAGGQLPFLFKSGGALDLMLSTGSLQRRSFAPQEGDLRLLATMVNGKIQAALYQPVKPDASKDQAVTFASPVGSVTFDSVTDVSDQVQVAQQGNNYELSVPLDVLGLDRQKLRPGRTFRGDIGLLRGEGGQTVERVYWSNEDTAIVSDVPSEARLQPANWGELHLTAKP
jgi:hypothetical protein